MPKVRCMCEVVKCEDHSCKLYNHHYTCEDHQLHVGDQIKQKNTGWEGYISNPNPWGSKRSVQVSWFEPHFDEGKDRIGKLFVGHAACTQLQKVDKPRINK